MTQVAAFDRCPPIANGRCMRDLGYHPAMCAFSATCCINAPVPQVEALDRESPGWGGRYSPKREKVAA